jgi:hypothetical protein
LEIDRPARVIAEWLPQLEDRTLQHVVCNERVRPDGGYQLISCDDLSRLLRQPHQDLHHLGLDVNRRFVGLEPVQAGSDDPSPQLKF